MRGLFLLLIVGTPNTFFTERGFSSTFFLLGFTEIRKVDLKTKINFENKNIMRKAIVILTLLTILISCQKKYKSIENISHLEYLGLKGKIKEMNVSFFIDELSNSVFVPKEKTDLIGFNFLGRELNVYPNIGFNLTSDDCIIDANILKHVLISYIGNPKEIHYFFNDNRDNRDNFVTISFLFQGEACCLYCLYCRFNHLTKFLPSCWARMS